MDRKRKKNEINTKAFMNELITKQDKKNLQIHSPAIEVCTPFYFIFLFTNSISEHNQYIDRLLNNEAKYYCFMIHIHSLSLSRFFPRSLLMFSSSFCAVTLKVMQGTLDPSSNYCYTGHICTYIL